MAQKTGRNLEQGSVVKTVFGLAIPAVVAQLINMLYSVVDRIYIGNIPEVGKTALTGIGVTFPIIMVISAFSAFVGMGGAPLASIKLGEKDRKGAEKILGNGFVSLLFLSVVLTAFFLATKRPLLMAFGASENTIGYADQYLTIYLVGTVFVQLALGLNSFISAQGHATMAMMSVLIGAVLNILLDPLFIFVFHLGVQGAALATILSQFASALWVLWFLLSKKSTLRIRRKYFKPDWAIIKSICLLGISPFIMQSTESLVQIALNTGLQKYGGDIYVGSMTIILSIMQFITMPANGFGQGAQPFISYNYGAGKTERVRKAFRVVLITCVSFTTVCCALTIAFPALFVRMFTPDPELIAVTAKGMRVFMAGVWIFGAQLACQSTFLALGQAKVSVFIALLRKVILLVPLALLLPVWFGVEGIYFSEPIADTIAALTTIVLFQLRFHKILNRKSIHEN